MGFGSRGKPLHPVALSTYAYICKHPGANFSDIMEGVNIGNGTLHYALRRLEDFGMIIDREENKHHRYYPNPQSDKKDT